MKKLFALTALSITLTFNAQAADYKLKRGTITSSNGNINDSALGIFRLSGSMNISGQGITQTVTVCFNGPCQTTTARATILSVNGNNAGATLRDHVFGITDLTLLTTSPNIITMFVFTDGTVETNEWEPVNVFSNTSHQVLEGEGLAETTSAANTGQIGGNIAGMLKSQSDK